MIRAHGIAAFVLGTAALGNCDHFTTCNPVFSPHVHSPSPSIEEVWEVPGCDDDNLMMSHDNAPFTVAPIAGNHYLFRPVNHASCEETASVAWWDGWIREPRRVPASVRSHLGSDWVPQGGDQNAVAIGSGIIIEVQKSVSVYCPLLQDYRKSNFVILEIGRNNEAWRVSYFHLADTYVREGQQVTAGEPVGVVGQSGCSEFIHLHLKVEAWDLGRWYITDPLGWNGDSADPLVNCGAPKASAPLFSRSSRVRACPRYEWLMIR
jgi:hypothetical protein